MKKAIIIPKFTKGDRRDPKNYRGISILNAPIKYVLKSLT
jgi:hypothetical protein